MNVLQHLESMLGEDVHAWTPDWAQSEKHRPNGWPGAPGEGDIEHLASRVRIRPEARKACVLASRILRNHPGLERAFRHCHWCLFGREGYPRAAMKQWPEIPASVDPLAPLFYALVLLAGIPAMVERNRSRSIPDAITLETLHDLDRWIHAYHVRHGGWGLAERNWFWHHAQGRIFALGRLQFCLDTYRLGGRGFRRGMDVRVFAPAGARVRTDGQYDGATGVLDPAAFVTDGWENADRICGHLITPDGRIQPELLTLNKRDWHEVLRPEDPGVSVHIPAGQRLDPKSCADSFARAQPFFARHFSEVTIRVIFTVSWLLDNEWERLLPPGSNIVRFQKMFYRVPVSNADDRQMWGRVFNMPDGPGPSPTERTSLQRVALQHIRNGGHFHIGGGLIFPFCRPASIRGASPSQGPV